MVYIILPEHPVNAGAGPMDHISSANAEQSGDEPDVRSDPRTPALAPAAALAAGVLCDRWFSPDWAAWMFAAAAALVLAVGLRRRVIVVAWCLVALWLSLGGARHHWVHSMCEVNDVARYATHRAQPAELIGTAASAVETLTAEQDPFTPEWMRLDRSICTLDAAQLVAGSEVLSVSGRVRLEVDGHLLHVDVGDQVRVVGQVSRPRPPQNPGGFDFGEYLRDRGIDCLLRCEHPDAVQVTSPGSGFRAQVANWRNGMRRECRDVLIRELSPEHVPLASSLLLGDRTRMTDDLRTAFAESGTMHLLAISGLHVGILAGLVFVICRLLNAGPVGTAAAVLLAVWLYAFVTDHRPPVLRAAVLATLVICGTRFGRAVNGLNVLAVTAIVILLWSPTDLFDVGAQLSFLAVAAILWAAGMASTWKAALRRNARPAAEPGPWGRALRKDLGRLGDAYLVTAAIWVFTLPLVLARFHLAAPVGFVLNVLLIPFVALALAWGYLLLFAGILLPPLAPMIGAPCDLCLGLLQNVAEESAHWRLGHVYLPGPPAWWLAGAYLLLGAATRLLPPPFPSRRAWQALAIWTTVGLAIGLLPARRTGLKCTFLALGHGCGIVLELPHGRTILYDAGALGAGRRSQQTIQEALWEEGIERIDALVISHADLDHFNGAAGLLETMRIKQLLIHRTFLDFEQESVVAICDAAAEQGAAITLVQAGDRLRADPEASLTVVHPPPGFNGIDNENSLVLAVEYAGRSILLTGDLEEAGLESLLSAPSRHVDVLLAPHHGSRRANPPELAAWAGPEYVIVSTSDSDADDHLSPMYSAAARVLSTAESGAVTVTISPQGAVTVDEFLASESARQ